MTTLPLLPAELNAINNHVDETMSEVTAADGETASVGIIYPPPEIRTIADKTAAYVAGSGAGAQLEERLRQSERNNPKFCFLNPADPYHAYYVFKVQEAKSGKAPQAAELSAEVEAKVEESMKAPPEEPPTLEFMTPMPPVSAQDLDIIKLTAQFVARNGRKFMEQLQQREANNFQFDFLRSNHSLFAYFSKLVEQYTKIIVPGPLDEIAKRAGDKYAVQDMVIRRVEYTVYQQETRKKRDEKEDAERMAFFSIDWQDFVVVETIEFTEADETTDLPAPKSLTELENMSLAQKRMVQVLAESERVAVDTPQDIELDDNDDVDMEDSDDEENDEPTPPPQKMQPQTVTQHSEEEEDFSPSTDTITLAPSQSLGSMKIKDSVTTKFRGRTAASLQEATQMCPRCGEHIPMSEMAEHVRIELLDPKWKELREISDAKTKASNMLNDGNDIASNLKTFKTHRTDIFMGDEEERKAAEEKRSQAEREKNAWDGQAESVALTAQRHAAAAAAAASANYNSRPPYGQQQQQHPQPLPPPGGYYNRGPPPQHYQQQHPVGYTQGQHPQHPPPMPPMGYNQGPPPSANLPPRPLPPPAPLSVPTSTGLVPAAVPPPGRHPEDDREAKRVKMEHTSPAQSLPPPPLLTGIPRAPLPSQQQQMHQPLASMVKSDSDWITLVIQFADDSIKPEWNRDGLKELELTDLVAGTMISTVKDRISAATGFPVGKQKLVVGEKVTKNSETLREYGFRIGHQGELRLMVKK